MADVDYGKILKRSWDITKTNKWLWIYGALLGAAGGSGGGSGGGSSRSSLNLPNSLPSRMPTNIPEQTQKVLGVTSDFIHDWFVHIPIGTWILISVIVLVAVCLALVVGMILRSWAVGSLIGGLADADEGKPVTLASTSPYGKRTLKSLIYYSVYTSTVVLGEILVALVLLLIGLLVFSANKLVLVLWIVLLSTVSIFVMLLTVVSFVVMTVYAERLIVLHGYDTKKAIRASFGLGKKNFLQTILMGILNNVVSCVAGCASSLVLLIGLGIPALIFIVPAFKDGLKIPNPFTLVALGILLILFITVSLLIRALLTVFSYSNWNLFVKEILKDQIL